LRIFHTDRAQLQAAFAALLEELRSQLYQSKHWQNQAHQWAGELTLSDTRTIRAIVEKNDPATFTLDDAKQDAHLGTAELRAWPRAISGAEIVRPELEHLKQRVQTDDPRALLLIGEAGSGKSALLARLSAELETSGTMVFGIKADALPSSVQTIDDIGRALGLKDSLEQELSALARSSDRVVLIIDQLDAVSQIMDSSSQRMRLLLRLVRELGEKVLPVHVIISSRPFEAAHDARFQQLKAEQFSLALPSVETITDFLTGLTIDSSALDASMRETLRRPFALKIFVQIVQDGMEPCSIKSIELLDLWLTRADLGDHDLRPRAIQLMEQIASDMLTTESLWRPLDRYIDDQQALARCEACGLLVRSGDKIGFSHQSWLDDFQAKSFQTGKSLADYAWQNQDSLFVRATVLRSLERLRRLDDAAYRAAVNLLLWSDQTRRHLNI
jgi:predicted ATPase